MKITKYEHACFTVEKNGKLLVVDPGAFTSDLPALESVVGVLVTHEHADHYDVNALGAIISHNPGAVIYGHETITRQLGDALPHQAVAAGDTVSIEPFDVTFVGGEHAVIHPDIPNVANLGVLIDELIYYPGDSFSMPDKPVDTLALPTAGPWMKLQEAIDFMVTLTPRIVFPTHDAVDSDIGKNLADSMLASFAEKIGATYQRLNEPLEIDG